MMIYINILYNGPYVCNFKIPLPFLPKLEGLGWIRETNFHPYWTHFDSTIRPRRLINEMFELNIYLFSESQFSAIIVIIGSISMNNSFQLKLSFSRISAFSNLFHILFDLIRPRSTSILFVYPHSTAPPTWLHQVQYFNSETENFSWDSFGIEQNS